MEYEGGNESEKQCKHVVINVPQDTEKAQTNTQEKNFKLKCSYFGYFEGQFGQCNIFPRDR